MGKARIWELDALRGLCVMGMVAVHFVYDLVSLYGLVAWEYSPLFSLLMDWGGVAFLLISGICVTLGSRCIRRGLTVFGCGLLVTAVTGLTHLLGLADAGVIIWFGVLHCLGVCMVCWYFLRKRSVPALSLLAGILTAAGFWLQNIRVPFPHLIWLGLTTPAFATSDYFPLLPWLGFFLAGTVLGRTLYRNKRSLLPGIRPENPLIRFCSGCGRHALPIYLLHQPALSLLIMLFANH